MLSKLTLASLAATASAKDGVSFVVIGDFANLKAMGNPNKVFDNINQLKANADPNSAENFDFFVTTGDNLYVADAKNPTQEEFKKMMDLFLTRNSIKDLPIYPVRGNHDCLFNDMYVEPKLQQQYPTW